MPRFGATYDLTGDGKTVLKANYGRFAFNPGVNLADAVSENTANQYEVWPWQDLDGDRIYDDNEKVGTAPTQKFGGVANTFARRRTSRTPTPTRPRSSSSARW